jgi:hypothetical protein
MDNNARRRERYATDPEYRAKAVERARKRRETNPEDEREYQRRYYERHKDEINAKSRAKYASDPEMRAATRRRARERAQRDPEAVSEYGKRWQRRVRYGVDDATWQQMLADQEGACAVCRAPFGNETPRIDHDHACCPGRGSCGRCVRALLCDRCNLGIGRFGDDAALMRAAADYIDGHRNRFGGGNTQPNQPERDQHHD